MMHEDNKKFIHEWRTEILNNKDKYPALYDDEIKKNKYKINGVIQ